MVTSQPNAPSLANLTGQIELVEDSIILNEEFKKNVAIPYFKDIYRDLVSQSDSKTKGINKVTMLTVSTLERAIHNFFSTHASLASSVRDFSQ
jgi:hypothetical protein